MLAEAAAGVTLVAVVASVGGSELEEEEEDAEASATLKLDEEVAKLRPVNRSLEDEEVELDSVACATNRQALPSVDLMMMMIRGRDGY